MGTATHIHILVERARNLKLKGNGETNDAFVIIQLVNDKFRTSIIKKAPHSVEWMEECEFQIPKYDNSAELILKVKHNGKFDKHHFLGMVSLPLKDLITDVDADATNLVTISKWYTLKCKPNQNKNDYRGDLKVTVSLLEKQGYETHEDSLLFKTVDESNSQMNSNDSSEYMKKCTKRVKGSQACFGAHGKRFWKNKNKGINVGIR